MGFIETLLRNHPLANILFALVLILGSASYLMLPREQDPEISFNWVNVTTVLPGASAEDVERLITNPLEDAIKGVSDLRFVTSNSRESVSTMLIRFQEIDQRTFDKRISDLRRAIQNEASAELPEEAGDPLIVELTTSNGFPTAIVILQGQADDESLRENSRLIQGDLERISGVDNVIALGLRDPELRIRFDPARLAARGLTPTDLADGIRAWFRDVSAGSVVAGQGEWLVRLSGQSTDLDQIANIPITSRSGASSLVGDVALVERTRSDIEQITRVDGQPAVTLSINKKSKTNTLDLVARINDYIDETNPRLAPIGLRLSVGDDQTVPTRKALSVMQTNALQGLLMVVLVCFVFLGWKVALLVGIGIPFSLAGTFGVLYATGFTLNVSVLLATVISLGMIVDDAVVVVESIYYRIARGQDTFRACVEGLAEVWRPVLSSVATTMAAFLPLMLLPGIVGKFMFVIPFVVSLALLISLVEAFWMLPTHIHASGLKLNTNSKKRHWRAGFNRKLRLVYGKALVKALRHPIITLVLVAGLLAGAVGAFVTGQVKIQFFAFDSLRIYYLHLDMPPAATIEDTANELARFEKIVKRNLGDDEVRTVIAQSGLKFTETGPVYGDGYGQLIISLKAQAEGGRTVAEIVEGMRGEVESLDTPGEVSFLQLSGGPPRSKPISVKVRGDDYNELQAAVVELKNIVTQIEGTVDVTDDDVPGRPELSLKLRSDALRRAGLDAATMARIIRLTIDGEVVSVMRSEGNRIEMRVQARQVQRDDIVAIMQTPIALPAVNGAASQVTTLGALADFELRKSRAMVRHYNLRRSIVVEGNLVVDSEGEQALSTTEVNQIIEKEWAKVAIDHPRVNLEFGGELEDVNESLEAMFVLFPMGVGLIYLILAAQFRSYFQPFLMIATVPLAFAGVTIGLVVSGNPLSLFTMYGVIALVGIAVNSAIVLTDSMNKRLRRGWPVMHAVVWAGRRRVVPVMITSLTTIAGLFSLAIGLGGKSLLWGPIASSIVWGLGVATLLTLFVVPLLYACFMRPVKPEARQASALQDQFA
ncbi:MAG: efflux RND transporter permease subunit [Burkholderiaceae bacterium]